MVLDHLTQVYEALIIFANSLGFFNKHPASVKSFFTFNHTWPPWCLTGDRGTFVKSHHVIFLFFKIQHRTKVLV